MWTPAGEPQVRDYMTLQPQTVDGRESLIAARDMMVRHGIRHLPVVVDGIVVGVLNDRQIDAAIGVQAGDAARLRVSDVCADRPYIAYPETSLREVAQTMAVGHYDCVLVMENAKVAGIFTATDACHALAEWIEHAVTNQNLERLMLLKRFA